MSEKSISDVLQDIKKLEERGVIPYTLKEELWKRALKEGPTEELIEDLAAYRMIGLRNDITPNSSQPPKKSKGDSTVRGLICLVAVVFAGIYMFKDPPPAPKPKPIPIHDNRPTPIPIDKGSDVDALSTAQRIIRNRLVAPSTADFPWFDFNINRIDSTTCVVQSYVDHQNIFGAKIRTHYRVRLQYMGKDRWRLLDVDTW